MAYRICVSSVYIQRHTPEYQTKVVYSVHCRHETVFSIVPVFLNVTNSLIVTETENIRAIAIDYKDAEMFSEKQLPDAYYSTLHYSRDLVITLAILYLKATIINL